MVYYSIFVIYNIRIEGSRALLLGFLKEVYRPDVTSVEIRTLAISLNSFNGFLTLANGESFSSRAIPEQIP
jgi:hypothetical protein